jgi:hypothetical protein
VAKFDHCRHFSSRRCGRFAGGIAEAGGEMANGAKDGIRFAGHQARVGILLVSGARRIIRRKMLHADAGDSTSFSRDMVATHQTDSTARVLRVTKLQHICNAASIEQLIHGGRWPTLSTRRLLAYATRCQRRIERRRPVTITSSGQHCSLGSQTSAAYAVKFVDRQAGVFLTVPRVESKGGA